MELTLIHFNGKYKNFMEASKKPDGLLFISVLFKLDPVGTPDLSKISDAMKSIAKINAKTTLPADSLKVLSSFKDQWKTRFYSYEGSRTIPPCTENVIHIVFPDMIPISSAQLKEFRAIMDEQCHPISDHSRPIQDNKGTTINRSFDATT